MATVLRCDVCGKAPNGTANQFTRKKVVQLDGKPVMLTVYVTVEKIAGDTDAHLCPQDARRAVDLVMG
jgi:hypothetical protein